MKPILTKLFAYVLLLMPFFGLSQDLAKDSIRIQGYLKEVDKSKSIPRLFTITDPQKVEYISSYIEVRSKMIKDEEAREKAKADSRLGVRYKNGDKTVIPEVVAILKSMDTIKIGELLNEMDYDEIDDVKHTLEPEIREPLFALVSDAKTESDAVQYLGSNHIEGSFPVFEKRFLSGKSTNADRLFFWIAKDDQRSKSIDYIAAQYKSNPNFFDELNWTVDAMNDCMEKASQADKDKIMEIAYDFLDKKYSEALSPKDDDELFSGHQSYKEFYDLAIKYGSKDKMRSYLTKVMKVNNERAGRKEFTDAQMDQALDIIFIKEAEPKQQQKLILSLLTMPNMFFFSVEMMQKIPQLENDPELLGKVFKAFEYCNENDQKDSFVQRFSKLSAADFAKYVEGMSSPSFRQEIMEIYAINAKTFEQNNDALIALGLTNKKITDADIAELKKKDPYFEKDNSMYSALMASGISINFDAEVDEIPVRYSDLLDEFSKASQGKFGPIKSYVQTAYNKKKQTYDYRFLVVCNNKCFVMVPEDSGDWYDMAAFDNLIQTLSDEMKLTEKFVTVDTGDQTAWYIFGQPEKVQELVENYKLAAESGVNEE